MNAAILCPGPSLPLQWKGKPYELTAVVNRAVYLLPDADWLVSLDMPTLEALPRRHPKHWLTMQGVASAIEIPPNVIVETVEDWQRERLQADVGGACWSSFSMTAALIACHFAGATHIDLFGYDAAESAPDFDGVQHPQSNRSRERWEHEAICFSATCEWLASHGTTVERIKPQ